MPLKKFCSYLSILAVLFVLVSCAPGNQPDSQALPGEPYDNRYNQQPHAQQTTDKFDTHQSGEFNITTNREAEEVAERLVTLATKIDKVNDATAVVVGRWAVVGIDVDATLERSEVGTVKYSVAEALRDDPIGAYAIITADIDTNQRLREMNEDIRSGQPIQGIMEELADIVGRLMPQFPRDINEPTKEQDNLTEEGAIQER